MNSPERLNKRVHVALPIRVTYWDSNQKPGIEMACTYDISPGGARISGLRCIRQVGDVVAIERGRSGKAYCRVVWIGESNSELRGQVGIECVELGRTLWEPELAAMEEAFDPLGPPAKAQNIEVPGVGMTTRRQSPRFEITGGAELIQPGMNALEVGAHLKNLSERGCLLTTQHLLEPGTDLKLVLNVANYDVTVKGKVRHAISRREVGVEFAEIRKGDRPVLQFLMRKLAERQFEGCFQVAAP